VESTKATKHYGVEAWNDYNEDLDSGQLTSIRRDGAIRCLTMTWYINIDDDMRRDQVIKFPFYRSLDEDFTLNDLIFESELYECKDKLASRHRSDANETKQNCTVKADFRSVDRSKFQEKQDAKGKR
jgi:hypothetical protein